MGKSNINDWFSKELIYEKDMWNDGEHRIMHRKWKHLDKYNENSYHENITVYEIEFYNKISNSWYLSARYQTYKEALNFLGF